MKINTIVTTKEHDPVKRRCSLETEVVIEPGIGQDYISLSAFHYRDTAHPPAVHQVYRARHVPSGRTVAVIVYAAPALNLGIRNRIFGDRYRIGGGSENGAAAARLNSELELIIRVVVHSTFRGTGIGHRIIASTLPLRPYRYIEMSAAMGSINPFAERAGMQAIPVPRPANTERVLAALRSAGLTEEQTGNPAEMLRAVRELKPKQRAFVLAEMERYATRWIKSRTKREVVITPEIAAKRIAANALLRTTYYLWENPVSQSA